MMDHILPDVAKNITNLSDFSRTMPLATANQQNDAILIENMIAKINLHESEASAAVMHNSQRLPVFANFSGTAAHS